MEWEIEMGLGCGAWVGIWKIVSGACVMGRGAVWDCLGSCTVVTF